MGEEKIKVAFFDSKEYDIASFNAADPEEKFEVTFYETRLSKDTVKLADGADVVCVFVKDDVNRKVIETLVKMGVKLIALRCA